MSAKKNQSSTNEKKNGEQNYEHLLLIMNNYY